MQKVLTFVLHLPCIKNPCRHTKGNWFQWPGLGALALGPLIYDGFYMATYWPLSRPKHSPPFTQAILEKVIVSNPHQLIILLVYSMYDHHLTCMSAALNFSNFAERKVILRVRCPKLGTSHWAAHIFSSPIRYRWLLAVNSTLLN